MLFLLFFLLEVIVSTEFNPFPFDKVKEEDLEEDLNVMCEVLGGREGVKD